jgi:hypothetical protein
VDTSDAANRQRFYNLELHTVGSDTTNKCTIGVEPGETLFPPNRSDSTRLKSMERFSAIFYNACPIETVLGDDQNSTLQRSEQTVSSGGTQ